MFETDAKRIPSTLAELADPKRAALLIWDMEYAIGPNAFNYKDILPNLQQLSAAARQAGVPVFYSVQTPFDVAKEEAGVWIRIRMKRANSQEAVKTSRQVAASEIADFSLARRAAGELKEGK